MKGLINKNFNRCLIALVLLFAIPQTAQAPTVKKQENQIVKTKALSCLKHFQEIRAHLTRP